MSELICWVAVAGFLAMVTLNIIQGKLVKKAVDKYENLINEFVEVTMENIVLKNKLEDIKDERDSEHSDWRSVEDRR